MQAVPNEILQRAYERRPVYLLKLPLMWALVVALGYAGNWAVHHLAYGVPVAMVAGVCIGMLVRGLGSFGHDAVHGSVSKNKYVTYLFGFAGWSATLMSYTLYQSYHIDHHRIVNMPHDVDRVQVSRFTANPSLAVALRMAIYTGLYPVYWASQVGRYATRLSLPLKLRMYAELLAMYSVILWLYFTMGPVAFFAVVGTQMAAGAFFASITSMAEHFGIAYHPDHAYSSRTYATRSWFADWAWSGTPYHNEHHKYPGIPCYNLRRFHFEALPYYSPAVRANIREDFWPLIFGLWKQAAKANLEEEQAEAQRDRAAVESSPGIHAEAA